MIADQILTDIERAGLTITVIDSDRLKVEPRDRITEVLRDHIVKNKAELITLLSGGRKAQVNFTPVPCQGCERLEFVVIAGESIPGCLYPSEGPYLEGWRRIPAGAKRCTWTSTMKEATK